MVTVCSQEVDIPKGGVQELPDSTDLLKIAKIVKNETSADSCEKGVAGEGKLTQEDIPADNQPSSKGLFMLVRGLIFNEPEWDFCV